ncbi:hypothetical protein TWF718_005780 [Orbilia javanica]|uniref:Uncharacterized protein n=1 Tax=Orbilia javanica TaxID=47235 RepID=A0AAN8N1J3_9PEZI
MATTVPLSQQGSAPPDPPSLCSAAANTGEDNGDGTATTIIILISGTRPIQLGAYLKSPTNMSIKGALSLTDEDYEKIRDSIDGAIGREALLRDLDVDAKNSTEEQRKRFHNLLGSYLTTDLTADMSGNARLIKKLTVQYKDVSPWLLYKFALLRRKKYKNSIRLFGFKEDSNDEHFTIDIGNPDIKEEDIKKQEVKTKDTSNKTVKNSPPTVLERFVDDLPLTTRELDSLLNIRPTGLNYEQISRLLAIRSPIWDRGGDEDRGEDAVLVNPDPGLDGSVDPNIGNAKKRRRIRDGVRSADQNDEIQYQESMSTLEASKVVSTAIFGILLPFFAVVAIIFYLINFGPDT